MAKVPVLKNQLPNFTCHNNRHVRVKILDLLFAWIKY